MRRWAVLVVITMLVAGTGIGRLAGGAEASGLSSPSVARAHLGGSTCPEPASGVHFYAPGLRGHRKTVALTFDDGPGPSTPAILRILLEFKVRATFFNIGENEALRPNDVRSEGDDGFLVGDHTWSHPDMTGLSSAAQAAQLDGVVEEQRSLLGSWPCAFRPPYGDYDATTLSLAQARHMAVWLWSVDTEDWKAEGSGSTYWVDRIISLAESEGGALDHPVVLMHNQSIPMPATVAALPTIIEYFRDHGYAFVDLLGRTGPPGSCGSGPGGFATPPSTRLDSGRRLPSGASMPSPGRQYHLVMQTNGDLELQAMGMRSIWATNTSGHPGAALTMRTDGDLVVASRSGAILWQSGTSGRGAHLALRADGDLAVVGPQGQSWSSSTTQSSLTSGERLEPGWYLESPNMACRLLMQDDGDLTLFSATRQVLWSSMTSGATGAFAVMERNGSLLISAHSGLPVFSLGTQGNPGAVLTLARLSQVLVRSRAGRTLWSSG